MVEVTYNGLSARFITLHSLQLGAWISGFGTRAAERFRDIALVVPCADLTAPPLYWQGKVTLHALSRWGYWQLHKAGPVVIVPNSGEDAATLRDWESRYAHIQLAREAPSPRQAAFDSQWASLLNDPELRKGFVRHE